MLLTSTKAPLLSDFDRSGLHDYDYLDLTGVGEGFFDLCHDVSCESCSGYVIDVFRVDENSNFTSCLNSENTFYTWKRK